MVEAEGLFARRYETHTLCIVGGGVIGEALARILADTPTDIMIIDHDGDRARRLAEALPSITVVHGDGTDVALLNEEQVGRRDLFVAVTGEDEVNLMACLLAKRVGVQRTISVVHRPDYGEIYRQLGVDVVLSPRTVASEHVLRYCRQRELQSLTVIEDGQAEILELIPQEGSRIIDTEVRRLPIPRGALLAAILKGERVVIPRGDDRVEAGDIVVVLTTPGARNGVARLFRNRSI